jgi:hypothetical protein
VDPDRTPVKLEIRMNLFRKLPGRRKDDNPR